MTRTSNTCPLTGEQILASKSFVSTSVTSLLIDLARRIESGELEVTELSYKDSGLTEMGESSNRQRLVVEVKDGLDD